MTTIILACSLMMGAVTQGAGKLGYFTEEALASADMSGVSERIEAVLAKCDGECAAAERFAATKDRMARDMILDRVEIARQLKTYVAKRHSTEVANRDSELLAWQGAEELDMIYRFFATERRRAERLAKLPAPIIMNLADFGAVGDGKTDCMPAFTNAIAAAKAKHAPVTLKLPDGVFLVSYVGERRTPEQYRNCREYYRGVESAAIHGAMKDQAKFHLVLIDMDDFTIEGSLNTEVRFADATRGGFGLFGCVETKIRNLKIGYAENPSTQGTVIAIRENPFGFVFRKDAGYPDPDIPRFEKAYSRRFTLHAGDDQLFKISGTGRLGPITRQADGTFFCEPLPNMVNNPYWHSVRVGDRVSMIARYSESALGYPFYATLSAYVGAERVTVYDAPGQNFIMWASYAPYLVGCTVRARPGSGDLVSSNADGSMNGGSFGVYIRDCNFEAMEDDGLNIGYASGATLGKVADDRMSFSGSFDRDHDAAFLVDGVTGLIKDVLRCDPQHRNRFRRPITTNYVDSAKINEVEAVRARLRQNNFNGTIHELRPDRLVQLPSCPGAVVRNTRFHNLRGMGIQVHCANMLIDGCTMDHHSGPGANINPLFGWGMLFNVHNIIVRNCHIRDISNRGFMVAPGCVPDGYEAKQRMIQGIRLYDNEYELPPKALAVYSSGSGDIEIEKTRFEVAMCRKPSDSPTTLKFEDAASIEAKPLANGRLEIVYRYDERQPAEYVKVNTWLGKDGERRYTFAMKTREGWFAKLVRFPMVEVPWSRNGDSSDDCLIIGSTKGGVLRDPIRRLQKKGEVSLQCRFPWSCVAAFAAAWDDESGEYLAAEDPVGSTKLLDIKGGDLNHPLMMWHTYQTWATGEVKMPYECQVRKVTRTGEPLVWQDFADIYRQWNVGKPWVKTPYVERPDIPEYLKKGAAFVRFNRDWLAHPERIEKFVAWWKREFGNYDVVAALWGWEHDGTWWGPNYFPAWPNAETFERNLKFLKSQSFHTFMWPSGYNWCEVIGLKPDGTYEIDNRERFIKPVEPHLVVTEKGEFFHQKAFWLRNGSLTTLCGGDPWARDWWDELTRQCARLGCEMVQVDQMVSGGLRDCWSTKHSHPLGGDWQFPTFRGQMLSMHKALREICPEGVVGLEEPNAQLIDIVGIQDYRDMQMCQDEVASVFNYLYHGYAQTFQSNPRRDDPYSIAHQIVDGQMPFYRIADDARLEDAIVCRSGDTFYQRQLKAWVKFYHGEGLDFVVNGFQTKPPRLECRQVQCGVRIVPAVCHQSYRALDGREALVLANATETQQDCACIWHGVRREFTLAAGEILLIKGK